MHASGGNPIVIDIVALVGNVVAPVFQTFFDVLYCHINIVPLCNTIQDFAYAVAKVILLSQSFPLKFIADVDHDKHMLVNYLYFVLLKI